MSDKNSTQNPSVADKDKAENKPQIAAPEDFQDLNKQEILQGRNALFGVRPQAFQKYQEISMKKSDSADSAEVMLYGPIVPNQILAIFGRDFGVSDIQFRREMEAITDDEITLRINSPGGDVMVASSMVNCVMDRINNGGVVNAIVDGVCASSATLIAIQCKNVKMAQHGMYMIHEAEAMAMGHASDFLNMAKVLSNTNKNAAKAYAKRTNMKVDDLLEEMGKELYMDSEEAMEKGFVDESYGNCRDQG